VRYHGPYLNVRADVTTVGDATCALCHPDIAAKYAKHPMGRSVLPVTNKPVADLADGGHASLTALGSNFLVNHVGNRLVSTETRTDREGKAQFELKTEMHYAIGSGAKAQSFLSEHDGFVTQAAVTWFREKKLWDRSPGFRKDLHAGRAIQFECLYCHSNGVTQTGATRNRFEQPLFPNGSAIGCERCHGPGSEHVRLRELSGAVDKPDYSIVNPKDLAPALREAVCQQCHLEGEVRVLRSGRRFDEYRPGLPLDSVIRVLVRQTSGDDRHVVGQVDQMYASKCFQASGGALGCATCHDPHEMAPPEQRAQQYRAACLKCHDCSSPVSVRAKLGSPDNCIGCHMPQVAASDVSHVAMTDHRIPRTPDKRLVDVAQAHKFSWPCFFPPRKSNLQDPSEARDFAVGLIRMAQEGKAAPNEVAKEALGLLERAVPDFPEDHAVWSAKSHALNYLGRKTEALAAAQKALSLLPNSEPVLVQVAGIETDLDRTADAISHLRQVVALNPRHALYRQELANLLSATGAWDEARTEADEAVRLDPASATAWAVLAMVRLRSGDKPGAEEMFKKVEGLEPPNMGQLRQRFQAQRPK
jgi:predicted CxxxxCH...CXXCH cytochrome family protein